MLRNRTQYAAISGLSSNPSGGIVGPSWLDLPFLEHRQLFTKKEILGQGCGAQKLHSGVFKAM
jgi:hypothetical protein